MSIIQQLEDLKEWSQDSTRYERRLAFRSYLEPAIGGTIPPEWDDLSDREREYYRTGPWSTREDYSKGQLVQPGPGRQGYQGKGHNRWNLSAKRIAALDEAAKVSTDGKYTTYDSLPKDRPLRNKISKVADRVEEGRSRLQDPEAWKLRQKEGRLEMLRKKLRTDVGSKQLKWIATNSAYYTNPNIMIKDFKEFFNIRGDLGKAALFKDKTRLSTGVLEVGKNQRQIRLPPNRQGTPEFSFNPGNENRLFKVAIAQNNKAASKRINTALANVHEDLSALRKRIRTDKLTVEESLKLLRKRDLNALRDFDMLPGQGAQTATIKHVMGETEGFNPEHYKSYRILTDPIRNMDRIVSFLDNPTIAKEFGLNANQVKQVQTGWEKVSQGTADAGKWVDGVEGLIGKGEFRKMFGSVIFEHKLSKQFGKNWKFLPRDYLLRGQVGNQTFNQMKLKVYDAPIANKIAKYEKAYAAKDFKTANKLEKEINILHGEFNRITDDYMKDYTTSFKDGKFEWKTTDPSEFSKEMMHRYDKAGVGRQELAKVSLGLENLGTASEEVFGKSQLKAIHEYESKVTDFKGFLKKKYAKNQAQLFKNLGIDINKVCSSLVAGGGRIGYKERVCGMELVLAKPEEFIRVAEQDADFIKVLQKNPQRVKKVASKIARHSLHPWSLLGGELWFVGLDTWASRTRGIPLNEALDNAFIFYDFEEGKDNLMNVAADLGYSEDKIHGLNQLLGLAQIAQEIPKQEQVLMGYEQSLKGLTDPSPNISREKLAALAPGVAEKGFAEYLSKVQDQKDYLSELEQQHQSDWDSYVWNTAKQTGKDVSQVTDEDLDIGFKDLYKASEKKVRDEIIEAGQERYEDKERYRFPGSSKFGEALFTLWPPLFKERQKLQKMSEEELRQHNIERGYQPWEDVVGGEPLSPLHMKRLYGRGFGNMYDSLSYLYDPEHMAGGGIAGIRRPWAIPPESGPMPQGGGLSSQFNRVKKLTG